MLRFYNDPLMYSNLLFLLPSFYFFYSVPCVLGVLYACIFVASCLYHRYAEARFVMLDRMFASAGFVWCIWKNTWILLNPLITIVNVVCVSFYPMMCRECDRDPRQYRRVHTLWHACVALGSLAWAIARHKHGLPPQ